MLNNLFAVMSIELFDRVNGLFTFVFCDELIGDAILLLLLSSFETTFLGDDIIGINLFPLIKLKFEKVFKLLLLLLLLFVDEIETVCVDKVNELIFEADDDDADDVIFSILITLIACIDSIYFKVVT